MEPVRLRIGVIGTGYLGVTHAACMAELGHDVVAVDVDPVKVARLAAGEMPFHEPDLGPMLARHVRSGRLRFGTSFREVALNADVHFVCVGTPQQAGSDAWDTSHVEQAFRDLARHLDHSALIVGKSTVPVGTAERMAALVAEVAPAGSRVEVAWSPEFLREGQAVADTLTPDRLVFGVSSGWAEQMLRLTYQPLVSAGTAVHVTDPATSELVKAAANAFLATKISFVNGLAEICEATGADVLALADALGSDPRIGRRSLHPGLGYGGGCLPKDLRGLHARARELGVSGAVSFLEAVDDVNLRRRRRLVDLGLELLGSYRGARVCVLGASFKPGTDDIRDSPALHVASGIQRAGADVVVYDPVAGAAVRQAYRQLSVAGSLDEAVAEADLVLLLCEWDEFRRLDPLALGTAVRRRNLIDGRYALDAKRFRAAGWTYRA
ncbi:UDP-glucose 6-dehydrogenase [Actinoplanes sp. NBRC 14428]|uniref:UDP-glucose 6-dehydrogenase n=1 Tax=Pseudosporangium ferrugineum TaxID=439699 RepID=A0A2T0RX61_9ACTN|nr:UDP-glucose/GDP-mannose dehydrogenase family protein [Pseudosporangium ferrugineum]PRY25776.1 UDPglucose 6-dehydrogenase [Pseudosporangium ferrugineum]BCJ56174.1 UDP-glucose 6-dehydrogenase [Actinoplanes sp. NBRC 14428]